MFFVMKLNGKFVKRESVNPELFFQHPSTVESFAQALICTDLEEVKRLKKDNPTLEIFELSIGLEPAHL